MTGDTDAPLETALRRLALLFRVLALVWMGVMVAITLVADRVDRPAVVLGAFVLAGAAAGWSARHLLSGRSLGAGFLAVDGFLAVVVAVAPHLAGSDDAFYGGYPMSSVVLFALATGTAGGLAAAAVFASTQAVAMIVDATGAPTLAELVSLTVMSGVVALVVSLGSRFIRTAEERRARAEEDLEAERRRHAVEEARLAERVAVADDLHDSLLQTVRVLGQNASDPDRVRVLARRQERELRGMIERMHGDGRPGAAAELRVVAADVENLHGVAVDVVATGDIAVDDDIAELVRAARELIVNAARHSGAVRIDVTLEVSPTALAIVVRDGGSGFDTGQGGGHGLASVKDRMQRMGGELDISSSWGGGTEAVLTVPRSGP